MIIFRYIAKELYFHLLVITLILLVIFITDQFLVYLKDVARGHITLWVVGKLMLLQIPLLLGFLLPLSLFISILLVFARLYMEHEMTVLAACGMSQTHMLFIVMCFSTMVAVCVGSIMLWFEPRMQAYREQVFDIALAEASINKIIPQQFEYFGSSRVFYAEKVLRDAHIMQNVFFATKGHRNLDGTPRSWDITIAKQAREYINKLGIQFLVFNQGYRYVGTPGKGDYEVVHFSRYAIKPFLELGNYKLWPKDAPTLALWQIRNTNLAAAAELQWRMAMPISVIILALLAFPMSRVNPRLGKFTQLLPAILLYMGYGDLLFLGRAWIKKGHLSPQLGLWWIHGLMMFVVLLMFLYRFMQRRRGQK